MSVKIYYDIKQRTPEWFALRQLKMTASNASAVYAAGKGLDTYVDEIVRNYFSSRANEDYTDFFKSKATDRGNRDEATARFLYTMVNNLQPSDVVEVGFVTNSKYGKYVGASPDSLVKSDGMVEIKSHKDKVFTELAETGEIDKGYIAQMQSQTQIAERKWCDYFAYNPNFDPQYIQIRILPDPCVHAKLEEGYKIGTMKIKERVEKMGKIFKAPSRELILPEKKIIKMSNEDQFETKTIELVNDDPFK